MYEGDIGKEPSDRIAGETVGELFERIVSKPAIVREQATLRDAVDAILDSGLTRKAYVVDKEGVLRGTITIETIMRHVGYRLGTRRVGVLSWFRFVREMATDRVDEFMAKPASVTKDTGIVEIVRRVVEDHLNDFPVVDESNRLLGEVNTFSLLKLTRDVFRENRDDAD